MTDKNTKLPGNVWLEKQFTEYRKGLCYVNTDLFKEWIKLTSSQLGDLVTLSFENTISSQEDLVNRRMEYPGYYQSLGQSMAASVYDRATGAITSRNDRYTIQLFRRANLSTLSHELMHAVHLDMERLEREGQGTPELSRDLDVLRSWTAVMDDDVRLKKEYDRYQNHLFGGKPFEELSPEERRVSRETAKEEMTARGFEQYLREGVAPSRGLEGVFRRFRRWLMGVYREARALDVDLTGEVRALFDRMLTAEEQVRDAAGAWHIPTGAKKLPDALPLTDAERRAVLMLSEDAQERAVDTLIQEEKDDRTRKERSTESTVTLFSQDNSLSARFADMPMIEADSSRFFGPGKAIDGDVGNMRKAIKDWAKMNFPEGARYENADTGMKNIQITPKGVKDTLSHGYDELLARSVPFIPQIIKSGLLLASIEKKPGLMSHIFAGKIRLDGQDYVVGFVLRVDNNGNRFYDHELTKIIDPGWLYRDPLSFKETSYTGPANRGDVMNLLRDKLGVNDGTNHGESRALPLCTGLF